MSSVYSVANMPMVEDFPIPRVRLMPKEMITLDRLPSFELRVKEKGGTEIRSEYFKHAGNFTTSMSETMDLALMERALVKWLEKRYGSEWVPANNINWEMMAKIRIMECLFAGRYKHLNTPEIRISRVQTTYNDIESPQHGPQLKLLLDKNLVFRSTTYYDLDELNKWLERTQNGTLYDPTDLDEPDVSPTLQYMGDLDSIVLHMGGVAGWGSVFGLKQALRFYHRYLWLTDLFDRQTLSDWAAKRIDAMLPGVVEKGLVTNFEFLPEGQYFGGVRPLPGNHSEFKRKKAQEALQVLDKPEGA
jgi:hypothetical protein